MTKDSELKPCPFCGGEAEICENLDDKNLICVVCRNCKSKSSWHVKDNKSEAIKAWNTRPQLSEEGVTNIVDKVFNSNWNKGFGGRKNCYMLGEDISKAICKAYKEGKL